MNSIDDTYIDLSIANVEQKSVQTRTISSFYQSSTKVILSDTTNYKISILRFVLNTQSLPVFIPQLQAGSKNTTVYSVTMEYNGKQYQQYMEFEPQVLNSSDEYYHCLTYQYVLYLVNKCFQSCLTQLNALTQLPTQVAPQINIEIGSNICTLFADSTYYGYNDNNKINIYMNSHMYGLFTSFPNIVVNKPNYGMDFQINNLMSSDPNNLTQEYSTVGLWSPISSIVFTTNFIPILSTTTPPLQLYKNGVSNASASFNFMNIITDFIASDLNFTTNGFLIYESQNNRYISLKNNQELRNMDINVYWINKLTSEMNNIYLAPNSFSSIKILFTKDA